jgi:hypothetical protein
MEYGDITTAFTLAQILSNIPISGTSFGTIGKVTFPKRMLDAYWIFLRVYF